jgi:hypothetical protein
MPLLSNLPQKTKQKKAEDLGILTDLLLGLLSVLGAVHPQNKQTTRRHR